MDLGLKDRVAIIGGGSKGLGRACADSLAQEGTNLVICSRNAGELDRTAGEISAATGWVGYSWLFRTTPCIPISLACNAISIAPARRSTFGSGPKCTCISRAPSSMRSMLLKVSPFFGIKGRRKRGKLRPTGSLNESKRAHFEAGASINQASTSVKRIPPARRFVGEPQEVASAGPDW